MPDHQPPTGHDVDAPYARRVRIAAYIGTVVWLLTVVGVFSGWFDTRWDAREMPKLLTPLAFATPLFIVLVLPAPVLSFHGLRGAKIAVWLLFVALVAFVAMLAAPFVMPSMSLDALFWMLHSSPHRL
jgi:UDP-N-acetylmuramyl pentapeptide phosphotransferase/UDP-N-acetylglucosamine-1-phosphate transferase